MKDTPQFFIELFDPVRHRRAEFNCESVELTDFLQKRARKEMEARTSACFVLVAADDPGRIVGYYTLTQTAVSVQKLPEAMAKKLPRYPELGATLIGRLARDLAWRGREVGRLLVVDALRRCVRLSAEAGAVIVVTDPKDLRAHAFYESFGFEELDERRLFISMKELIKREETGWGA